jgi:hypothetical protein
MLEHDGKGIGVGWNCALGDGRHGFGGAHRQCRTVLLPELPDEVECLSKHGTIIAGLGGSAGEAELRRGRVGRIIMLVAVSCCHIVNARLAVCVM